MNDFKQNSRCNLDKLSKELLIARVEELAKEERRITSEVLMCLHEIESRMIYAELGFASLYEFCIKHLKYSEGAAHRRISAMRLLKGLPESALSETHEKIKSGSLSITNLSLMHGFLKVERSEKKVYSAQEKASLLASMENQSKRDVEKKLAVIQPKMIQQESKRVITEELTEIKFMVDEKLMKKLERIREISAHSIPGAGMAEIVSRLADEYLNRHDPMMKATSPATKLRVTKQPTKVDIGSRYIPAVIRAAVWKKSKGICGFKNCGSKYGLEIEHILPFALGGTHSPENLTLRCRAHNHLAAKRVFGDKMEKTPN